MTSPTEDSEALDAQTMDALYGRVLADLERERGPLGWLRARPTWARVTMLLAVAAISSGATVALLGKGHGEAIPIGRLVGALTLAALVVFSAHRSLRPLHRSSGAARAGGLGVALGAIALAAFAVSIDQGLMPIGSPGCGVLGALAGVPVLVVGVLLDRAPGRELSIAAWVAALSGSFAVHVLCPVTSIGHLFVVHFLALVVVVGAFAGARELLTRLIRR